MVDIVEDKMATGIPKTQWNDLEIMTSNGGYDKPDILYLNYDNKKSEKKILSTTPANVFKLLPEDDINNNRLYYGDNIRILSHLLNDPSIKGKVKLVYIDPPFSTNSIFQSRDQKDAYQDLLCGSEYIEFIRERLIFLRELLAYNGSIFVHLDEKMVFHIKIIMDEVFGKQNFRNFITRKKSNPKNYTKKTFGKIADYILFYTKSDDYTWNRPYEEWTDERALKEYQYIEESTGRRYKKVPLHAPGKRNGETGKIWHGMYPPPGKHWQFPPSVLDEMDARGEIYWSPNGNPRRKIYLDESNGIPIQDIWMNFKDAHNQNIKITGYPTEKNPDLLRLIIKTTSNPRDLVLDCFCGSGTTLEIASELNRRWIGIDNSPHAIETVIKRFKTGTQPMGDFVKMRNVIKTINHKQIRLDMINENNHELIMMPDNPLKTYSIHATEDNISDIREIINK